LSPETIRQARSTAKKTVQKSYPQKWGGTEVETDKSILDAILDLGDLYAKNNNTVFFVNESWTAAHDEYQVFYPSSLNGVVLAAVGNASENITSEQRDFADRSTSHKDTIAIMNLRPGTGLLCGSSFIDSRDVDTTMAIAFDGEIVGNTVCGTSFSSPRVAWLLAADEAIRKTKLDSVRWELVLSERLLKARNPEAAGYNKLWFDPIVFFRMVAE